MTLTHETRRALAERVQRKVEGRGIPRHAIDDAVARVGDALDRQSSTLSSEADRGVDRGRIHSVFVARPWLPRSRRTVVRISRLHSGLAAAPWVATLLRPFGWPQISEPRPNG